jgi:hypothetical protein
MGVRANLVTKYVCEYEGSQTFNYRAEEVYDMLTENDVMVWTSGGEGDYYGYWEVDCSSGTFEQYIVLLKELPPDEVNAYFDKSDSDNADYTNQYVREVLEEWLQHCDPERNIIRVHWF